MTTTYLVHDEKERVKGVYEARGEEEEGIVRVRGRRSAKRRRMVWGATCVRMAVACAHARPMVARLCKKYAARRKVNALSMGSSPKSSKKLTA